MGSIPLSIREDDVIHKHNLMSVEISQVQQEENRCTYVHLIQTQARMNIYFVQSANSRELKRPYRNLFCFLNKKQFYYVLIDDKLLIVPMSL